KHAEEEDMYLADFVRDCKHAEAENVDYQVLESGWQGLVCISA
ncbi:hypothetical protein A2U01_0072512, partial [Trifolium medium]|nr:hypothetical protein [Trifolium medium]